jgi:hypothetical protein
MRRVPLSSAITLGVGIERHRGTVPELRCDLDDGKAALVDQQTREAVAEVIGASALEPVDPGSGLVGPPAPVPVIVVAPRPTAGSTGARDIAPVSLACSAACWRSRPSLLASDYHLENGLRGGPHE